MDLRYSPLITYVGSLIFSTQLLAGFIPDEWQDSDEGIVQATFEGQYIWQSNNLAEGDVTIDIGGGMVLSDIPVLVAPNPAAEGGYRATLAYVLPAHQYDIRGSYWQVKQSGNATIVNSILGGALILDFAQQDQYNFHAADLTLGQYIDWGCCFDLRIGYGLAYANIEQTSYSVLTQGGLVTANETMENKFHGLGPKLGLDGMFDLNHHFSLVGGAGIAVLFGKSRAEYILDQTPGGLSNSKQESDRTVFETDAKAGINFADIIFDDWAFNIEAGYRGAIYFNALHDNSTQVAAGSDSEITVQYQENNYYNYGPYASFSLNFM